MKTKYIVAIAALTAIVTTIVLLPILAKATSTPEVSREPSPVTQELSPAQIIWLARLMQCESGIRTDAVNPKDLDHTPSYGILQFKPYTYKQAAIKYGLASTTDFKNPEGQIQITMDWILGTSTNWHQQFPACVDKLGVPPKR